MQEIWKISVQHLDIKEVVRSSHLNNELKNRLLQILPNLDKDQVKEIYNYIKTEEDKILNLENKIKQEESEFYKKMLNELDEYLNQKKKEIRKIEEENENEKDEEIENQLLQELNEI